VAEPRSGVMRCHGLRALGGIVAGLGCCARAGVCECARAGVCVCVCGCSCSCVCACVCACAGVCAGVRASRRDDPPRRGRALLLHAGALYMFTVGPGLGRQHI